MQLLRQVDGEVIGDPDGFGVYRNVLIRDAHAVQHLVLGDSDPRVRGSALIESDHGVAAIITFVPGTAADSTVPFEL